MTRLHGVAVGALAAIGIAVSAGMAMAQQAAAPQSTAPAAAPAADYSEQGFLDAALKQCLDADSRNPKSCDCEQKLIKDQVSAEDKEMAFYFWTNKDKFAEVAKTKAAADAKWLPLFGARFESLQALITAACGR